jgi:transcription elongation factor Elf1
MSENYFKCNTCKSHKHKVCFATKKNGKQYKCCIECRARYKCQQCSFKAAFLSIFEHHVKTVHEKIREFECPQCNYAASTEPNLRQHIVSMHVGMEEGSL